MQTDTSQRMQAGPVCPAAEGRLAGFAGEDADCAARSLLQLVRGRSPPCLFDMCYERSELKPV